MYIQRATHKAQGFTLIELIVTVAIIGILASIAYPNYISSVKKARRADAKAVLLQAAQWMERFATLNNGYSRTFGAMVDDVYTEFNDKSGLTKAPIEGSPKYYDISIMPDVTATSFKLIAAPIVGNGQEFDECQTLTLTNTGVKGVTAGATKEADQCWR